MSDSTEPNRDTPAEPESLAETAARLEAAATTPPATPAANPEAVEVPSAPLPPERVGRGLLFSLAVIPLGIIVWVLIWQLGFISAIVAFGISFGATFLYRLGSGGRISVRGLVVIIAVTLVALVLAFLGGMAADLASFLGISLPAALGNAEFWDTFALNVFDNPALWGEYTGSILMSLAFAALGAFGVLRSVFKETRGATA